MQEKKAKIICTLGPASFTEEKIEELILAGMDVARLNFSHGDHDFFRMLINRIRHVSAKINKQIAIMQDLQGPKIRCLKMENGSVELVTGNDVIITNNNILGTSKIFGTDYKNIINDVKKNDTILLDDGRIILICFNKDENNIYCHIEQGGVLGSNKGINLPQNSTSLDCLTKKDLKDLHFGIQSSIDAVALSFVRNSSDILRLKQELSHAKTKPIIIAKIEKPQAIDDLDNIIQVSDGVMVARGDLGVEVSPYEVPLLQKNIIERAIYFNKSVIVATEMLESMKNQIRPTRAESSDVANAILDGADMLMLSAETASGNYPKETVAFMKRIIIQVEKSQKPINISEKRALDVKAEASLVMAKSAVLASEALNAKAIVMFSSSGSVAKIVSNLRPKKPIIAFVPNTKVQRQLNFFWGVETFILPSPQKFLELLDLINKKLLQIQGFNPSDKVILLTKIPLLPQNRTNTVHILTLRPI